MKKKRERTRYYPLFPTRVRCELAACQEEAVEFEEVSAALECELQELQQIKWQKQLRKSREKQMRLRQGLSDSWIDSSERDKVKRKTSKCNLTSILYSPSNFASYLKFEVKQGVHISKLVNGILHGKN